MPGGFGREDEAERREKSIYGTIGEDGESTITLRAPGEKFENLSPLYYEEKEKKLLPLQEGEEGLRMRCKIEEELNQMKTNQEADIMGKKNKEGGKMVDSGGPTPSSSTTKSAKIPFANIFSVDIEGMGEPGGCEGEGEEEEEAEGRGKGKLAEGSLQSGVVRESESNNGEVDLGDGIMKVE